MNASKSLEECKRVYRQSHKKRLNAMQQDLRKHSVVRYMFSKLSDRNQSFYKFGFKSYQKNSLKKNIEQLLKLKHRQTLGSINISQFWTDKHMVYYLQEHKMYLNKKRLLRQQAQMKDKDIYVSNVNDLNQHKRAAEYLPSFNSLKKPKGGLKDKAIDDLLCKLGQLQAQVQLQLRKSGLVHQRLNQRLIEQNIRGRSKKII